MKIPKDWRPLLKGFEHKGQLVVWCPYCATFHHHGTMPGHRAAHCSSPESPFRDTGYYIAPFSRSELEEDMVELDEEYAGYFKRLPSRRKEN